ncbi:MAG: hypothetical protein GYB64_19755 [Chloroflexi bacterium]|nr:hypothetical protein [Chloroflexota bacterium]
MSRVINPNAPGKLRNQLMRTCAEIIKRLSQKTEVDDDVMDMTALLVFSFREIDEGIDQAVAAWEKRDYWVKAARFRNEWIWVREAADNLERIIREEQWDELPPSLIKLVQHFEDIKIARYTRKPTLWKGAYERLLEEQAAD